MKRGAGKPMAWAELNEFIDDQVRPTWGVSVLQIKRKEGCSVFLVAAKNSVRVFFKLALSLLDKDVEPTVWTLLTEKKPPKNRPLY